MSGRPLRFLIAALAGWTALRTVLLWPASEATTTPARPIELAERSAPIAQVSAAMHARRVRVTVPVSPSRTAVRFGARAGPPAPPRWPVVAAGLPVAATEQPIASALPIDPPASSPPSAPSRLAPFVAPLPGRPPSRQAWWQGSAWLAWRGGNGATAGLEGGGELGGSQVGARIAVALDRARRLAVVGRVTGPLRGGGREVALGIEWRPTRLPIRLVVERRFVLDGGRGGPAAGIVAGTGPAPLALGFDLESYGQAGVVRRARVEPFADGAVRVTRRVVRVGGASLDLGGGAWGGAQRDAQRLDAGPSLGVRLPIAGRGLRALADWRFRVVGQARPGSGPALTVGLDF